MMNKHRRLFSLASLRLVYLKVMSSIYALVSQNLESKLCIHGV